MLPVSTHLKRSHDRHVCFTETDLEAYSKIWDVYNIERFVHFFTKQNFSIRSTGYYAEMEIELGDIP
jgi:hypothetical protein